ncbi:citrate/2-methylcitrate synthase [Shigella flexneri]
MHADHEQNASTSTVRTAGSSGQPVCLYRGGYCFTVGTCARWC